MSYTPLFLNYRRRFDRIAERMRTARDSVVAEEFRRIGDELQREIEYIYRLFTWDKSDTSTITGSGGSVCDIIHVVHHFNTKVNADGTPRTGDALLEESFSHDIPNEFYLWRIQRPMETRQYQPPQTATGGSEPLGAYDIKFASVESKPYSFRVRFHQPEYGSIILLGASTVHRR